MSNKRNDAKEMHLLPPYSQMKTWKDQYLWKPQIILEQFTIAPGYN